MTTITIVDSGFTSVSKASKNRYYNEDCNYTYVLIMVLPTSKYISKCIYLNKVLHFNFIKILHAVNSKYSIIYGNVKELVITRLISKADRFSL